MKLFGVLITLYHVTALGQFVYAIYFDLSNITPDHLKNNAMIRPGFGGRLRFLTYWNLVSESSTNIQSSETLLLFISSNKLINGLKSVILKRSIGYVTSSVIFDRHEHEVWKLLL